jgi:hypothetical protein
MAELSETPFRVYRLDGATLAESDPACLGAADDVSLGELLRDMKKRGRITERTVVGIMYRPVDGEPGEWLVNPWAGK